MLEAPIPIQNHANWRDLWMVPIEESGEKLIPASYLPDKILCRPQYFIQGIRGAIPECYIRESAFLMLSKASTLLPKGYRLVIFDAWRPFSVQQDLFLRYVQELRDIDKDMNDEMAFARASRFVSPPRNEADKVSPHMTGGAVDVVLVDERGFLCPMGSDFDETSERSVTHYFEEKAEEGNILEEERKYLLNRRILYNAMVEVGFANYSEEWWHYDYGNQNWAFAKGSALAIYGKVSLELRWARFE